VTPHLKTERLRLYAPYHRAFDIEQHVLWLSDRETMKYSGQRHSIHTLKSQRAYVDGFDHIHRHYWEIATHRDRSHYDWAIGTLTAYRDSYNKTANLGLLIRRQSWGQGYGLEAWRAVMDWLFSDGVRKVEAGCYSKNIGMLTIFLKSGMSIEGRQRGSVILDDGPCDLILAGKIKDINHDLHAINGAAAMGQQTGHQGNIDSLGTSGAHDRTDPALCS
jgi:RimJ/RimL family protein N-acetyltransferase